MVRIRGLFNRYGQMMGDVAWSGLGDGLSLIANIISFLLLLNTLEPEVYGGYVGFFGIVGPIGALSWSGLSLLVLQRLVKNGEDPQTVTNRALAMTVAQGVAAVAFATAISTVVISTIALRAMVLMAIAELLVFPISNTTIALIQGTKGFATAAKLRLALPTVRVSALLATYYFSTLTIQNLALAWIFGFCVTGALALFVVLPRYGLRRGFAAPDKENVRISLELSTPMAASNLQTNGDKAVMNAYGLEVDAGTYGAAFRIVLLSQFPIQTMNRALFQRFLPAGDGRKGLHLDRAKRFAATSLSLSLVIALCMFVLSPILLPLLPGDDLIDVTIVRWLVPLIPLLAISRAPLNGLMGLGLTSRRAYLIVSAAAVSMAMYLVLIPTYSWKGAVAGTIIAEVYLALGGWLMLIRAQRAADNVVDREPDSPEADSSFVQQGDSWRGSRVES